MGTYISQFNVASLLLNTDIVAGLRNAGGGLNDYRFPIIGIGDSNGANIITWTQTAGTNINWIDFANNNTGLGPTISALGSDSNINLNISAKGTGHVEFTGTNAIGIPSGTTGQRPTGFGGGFRYNSTTDFPEYYSIVNSAWEPLSPITSTVTSVTGTANQITASPTVGNVILSIPSTFIAPGTIAAVTSVSSPEYLLTGSGSGTISILPQAAAGTYNFNMPITAGTSGYLLTSAGGAGSPMTWTSPSSIGAVTSVSGTTNRISVSPTTGNVVVDIDAAYVGQTSITTLGTVTTGTWNATTIAVAHGGTSNTTFTAYSVLCAGTTATGAFQNVSGLGTSGYVLTSNGAGALPTWQSNAGTTAIQTIDGDSGSMSGTTVTISGGSTGLTTSASGSTMNLTGVLKLANGGTNANLTASNGGIFYSTASAGAILSGTATANQVLLSGSSTAPAWSTATYPATTSVNQILYSSSANVIAGLATANNGVLITSGGGIPSISSTLPTAVQLNITEVGALTAGSLASGFTPVTVPLGGTGNTTFTAYSVICAGTTATGTFQNVSGVGTSGQVLTSNGAAALPTWQANSASSGALSLSIHQVAHGFSVGNVVYLSGSTYTLAEANAVATSEVIGIVLTVTDADNFVLLFEGKISGLSALSAGTVYYLSDSSPGALTATEPTTVGNVSTPLLVADSTTTGYFHRYRGKIIPTFVGWVDQTTTPVTMAAGTEYVADNAGLVTFNMPATATFGSVFTVVGYGAGGWLIQMNTGQTGHLNSSATTSAGSFASTERYDAISFVCTVANTTFVATSSSGVITNA